MPSKFRLTLYLFLYVVAVNPCQGLAQIIVEDINETIIGVGNFELDLNGDSNVDFNFEIITLPNEALAARVQALGGSLVLDNSGFGYPDALELGDPIQGAFAPGNGVLGTFNNAGQFNGQGMRYLGIRVVAGVELYDGWLQLDVSPGNDTLQIVQGAYQTEEGTEIFAGEGVVTTTERIEQKSIRLYPNPASSYVQLAGLEDMAAQYTLQNALGEVIITGAVGERIELESQPSGMYFFTVWWAEGKSVHKLLISR